KNNAIFLNVDAKLALLEEKGLGVINYMDNLNNNFRRLISVFNFCKILVPISKAGCVKCSRFDR
ncbi:MAG: hypothetical protein GY857_08120, partial [Desulfobacula sp.]|nr:hypothetical protein [Desulfobacula sp.]